MQQKNTDNDTCINPCDTIQLNSSCFPCIPPVLTPSDNVAKNITPILTDTITNCTSISNTQYMRSSPVQFMIDGPCRNFLTNGQISINSISYSYDCLGKSLPISFYICDKQQTFDVDGGGCSCFFNSIPADQEAEINNALNSANETLGLAESALSKSAPVNTKRTATIAAAVSLGTTLMNTANALTAIINSAYPGAASDTIQGAVLNLTSANQYVTDAADALTGLLSSNPPYNTATVQQTALAIYNPADDTNSATEYLTQAAQYVLSSSVSSSYARSQAQAAISSIQDINQLAQNVYNNPSAQTITNLTNLISLTAQAAINVYNALNDAASSDSTIQSYLSSLFDAFYAETLSAFASQAIYSSTLTTSTTSQTNNLNSAARAIIDAVTYVKDALNFPNPTIEVLLYNNFKTLVCTSSCNNCYSSLCNNDNIPMLFFQEIPSYEICNLTINICGTISGQCFTASAKYPGITDLSSFGFNTIAINSQLCLPKNSCYSLKERLDPCFSILCIIPEESYNSNSSNNAPYIQTSLYSAFSLNTDIIVTKKNPAGLLTSTVLC